MVSQLVQISIRHIFPVLRRQVGSSLEQVLGEGNKAHVFHGAGVEFRHKNLIIFMELERQAEEIFVEIHADLSDFEHLFEYVFLYILEQACSHEYSHGHRSLLLVFQHLVWASYEAEEIC